MKNLFIILILLLGVNTVLGQRISIETGQTISDITYIDDLGNELDNILANTYSYLKLGYSGNIFSERLHLGGKLGYNRYGASASDDVLNNFYGWDLTYVGAGISLAYDFFKPGNFTFSFAGEASGEFLVQGTQTINNQVFRLVGEEDFDTPIYMLRGGMSIDYKITNRLSAYTSYSYGGGSPFKKDAQKFNYNVHNMGIGLRINIGEKCGTSGELVPKVKHLSDELMITKKKLDTLEKRARKVDELEKALTLKEKEMTVLKDTLTDVLLSYGEEKLNVELNNGRIYITLEDDMLFKSGSYALQSEGREAVSAIAKILEDNPDMNILIEGHTDDKAFNGNAAIKSNWDLSTKRACAIVDVLQKNKNINPQNITVAGRAEYAPIADNSTAEGRARNRRIEVIIFPPLDKLCELLKN